MQKLVCLLSGLAIALGCVACGGDEKSSQDGSQPPPGVPVAIGASARIGWDQFETLTSRLARYSFVLYVDGARVPLLDTRCGQQTGASMYLCSGRLPGLSAGLHTLQLAAVLDGLESDPSLPFAVTISSSLTAAESSPVDITSPDPDTRTSCGSTTRHCFAVDRIFETQSELSSPSVLPDGRVMVIEDARVIAVHGGASSSRRAAFDIGADARRLLAITVDPDFERSRIVHVAWIDDNDPAGPSVSVSRLREHDGSLVDEAVFIPGVRVPPGGTAKMAQDATGMIYLLVSGTAEAGAVMRFTREGRVPWDHGQNSPAWIDGPARPYALTFDSRGRRLWISGADPSRAASLEAVDLLSPPNAVARTPVSWSGHDRSPDILAFQPIDPGTGDVQRFALADGDGRLRIAAATVPGSLSIVDELSEGLRERVIELTPGTAEGFYAVAVGNPRNFSLLRFVPLASRKAD